MGHLIPPLLCDFWKEGIKIYNHLYFSHYLVLSLALPPKSQNGGKLIFLRLSHHLYFLDLFFYKPTRHKTETHHPVTFDTQLRKRLSSLLRTIWNGDEIVKWKQQSDGTHKNEIENEEKTFKKVAKQGKASDLDNTYRYCVFWCVLSKNYTAKKVGGNPCYFIGDIWTEIVIKTFIVYHFFFKKK